MPLRRIAAGEGKSVFALGIGQSGPPIDNVLCTGVPRAGQVGKRPAACRAGGEISVPLERACRCKPPELTEPCPTPEENAPRAARRSGGRSAPCSCIPDEKCAPRRPAFRRTVSLHLRPGYDRVILTVRNISPWPNRLAPAAIRRRFEKPLRIRCAPAAVLAVFLHTACAQGAMHILFCSAERAGSRDCLP